jgi:hypothetical protein
MNGMNACAWVTRTKINISTRTCTGICSFSLHVRFGRKSNVRSEHALRSGCVALECVHINVPEVSASPKQSVDTWVCCQWIKILDFMATPNLFNFPKLWEMTISTATFVPSTPCTIHFECLESVPSDSNRDRRPTCILRRARVKIFILAYGGFWFQISIFSSNLTGIWSYRYERCLISLDEVS